MERIWLVGEAGRSTTVKRSMEADMDVYYIVYDIHVDTNCGKLSWNFSTSLVNDPALFQKNTYSSYSQNGPESYLELDPVRDTVCVECEPTGYETQLPVGVVRSIIDDLRDLAMTLPRSEIHQDGTETI